MDIFKRSGTTRGRLNRAIPFFATGALLSAGISGTAFAASSHADATLAIARAQANIDLVSKENPAETRDQSFASAQQKLAEAQTAVQRDHNQEAVWFANEAELLADTTAGAAKLTSLQQARATVAHDVEVLSSETHKKQDMNP